MRSPGAALLSSRASDQASFPTAPTRPGGRGARFGSMTALSDRMASLIETAFSRVCCPRAVIRAATGPKGETESRIGATHIPRYTREPRIVSTEPCPGRAKPRLPFCSLSVQSDNPPAEANAVFVSPALRFVVGFESAVNVILASLIRDDDKHWCSPSGSAEAASLALVVELAPYKSWAHAAAKPLHSRIVPLKMLQITINFSNFLSIFMSFNSAEHTHALHSILSSLARLSKILVKFATHRARQPDQRPIIGHRP